MNLGKYGLYIYKLAHMIAKMLTDYQLEPEVTVIEFIVNEKVKSIQTSLMIFLWVIHELMINTILILQLPLRENNSTPFLMAI